MAACNRIRRQELNATPMSVLMPLNLLIPGLPSAPPLSSPVPNFATPSSEVSTYGVLQCVARSELLSSLVILSLTFMSHAPHTWVYQQMPLYLHHPRNPKSAERPKFNAILYLLQQPNDFLLAWTDADSSVHSQAQTLGADLEIGRLLYPDLQTTYT